MASTTAARASLATNINDNTSGDITPADLRGTLTAILDAIDGAMPSVLQHGALGNNTGNDAAAFLAAQAASPEIYIPTGTYRITSNLNLAATLRFAPGAVLLPTAGVTIDLGGEIIAGFWQIFDGSLGGSITGKIRNQYILPDWWGGKPDVAASQSPYINWAITFAQIGGRTVYLRNGLWRCDETIFMTEPASIVGDPGGAAQGISANMSVLDFSNAPANTNGLQVGRTIDFPLDGASFRDFAIYRSALPSAGSTGGGLVFKSVTQGECHNLMVWNWGVGYRVGGTATYPSGQCEFRACRAQYAATTHWEVKEAIDCSFDRCFGGGGPATNCVNMTSSISPGQPNAIHWTNSIFVSPDSNVGMRVGSGFYHLVENCVFEEMNEAGIQVNLASVDISLISLSVVDCGFNNTGDGFSSIGANGNFRIRDCRIESTSAPDQYPIIIATTGTAVYERDIQIVGNSLKHSGSNTAGIAINNVSGAIIRDNRITCAGAGAARPGIALLVNTSAIRASGNRTSTTFAVADGISNGGTGNVLSDNSKY